MATTTETPIAIGGRYRSLQFGDVFVVTDHAPDRSRSWRIQSANPLGPSRWVTAGELRFHWERVPARSVSRWRLIMSDPVTTETGGQPQFPRDIWIDVETGAWGLVSNLHLVEQSALPIGDAIHDAAYMRCAGIDHGVPVAALLRSIDHV